MSLINTSDLVFSEQANHNFGKVLGDLKRSTFSIRNRLASIYQDADFAHKISTVYCRPLIANERCGSWYVPPQRKCGSVYFKSTDGHNGVWQFSSRRLNLHLLKIIATHDGCIIVDSTRRGKRMPDALSKTIPIWCAVINQYFFPKKAEWHSLHTPPQSVSPSEHAQISALLPSFVKTLRALDVTTTGLGQSLLKPLRPLWITPESAIPENCMDFPDFHPVICCTVSKRTSGSEFGHGVYIQGAGDDTENWAHRLTPSIFWGNTQILLSAADNELPQLIEQLVVEYDKSEKYESRELHRVHPTSHLFITSISAVRTLNLKSNCCKILLLPEVCEKKISESYLEVGIGQHKIGSRNLRKDLSTIIEFVKNFLHRKILVDGVEKTSISIIIACQTGTELSIGVGLAILCLFFDEKGALQNEMRDRTFINKDFIRDKLVWLTTSMPHANPSRATLQSVNSFLMSRPTL